MSHDELQQHDSVELAKQGWVDVIFCCGNVKVIHTVRHVKGAITNRHVHNESFAFGPVKKRTSWNFSEAKRYCQNSRDQTQEDAGQCWNVQRVKSSSVQTVHREIVPVPQSVGNLGRTMGKIVSRNWGCISAVKFHLDRLTARKKIITQIDTHFLA